MKRFVVLMALTACGGGGGGGDDGPDAGLDAEPRTFCGDSFVDEGEECDDGNDASDDGCIDCVRAVCGDGVVRAAVEECDDDSAGCIECATCAGTRDPATGHCYTIVETASTRANAQASCAAAGGYLAALDGAGEWSAIAPIWVDPYPSTWIGLYRAADGQNVWSWQTGVALGTGTWNTGEPNDAQGIEDCVETFGATGLWNDLACDQTRRALCERPGWEIDPATNHAYRIFHRLRTHAEALGDCAAMGAHLAVITSPAEQAYLAGLAPVASWIGGFQGATESSWFWANGEPFGFDAWADGQPDDYGANEDCAMLFAGTGEWNDLTCTAYLPYVCEGD